MKRFDNAADIQKIERLGFRVRIDYIRVGQQFEYNGFKFRAQRDLTFVVLNDITCNIGVMGVAVCHERDQFNKNFGLRVALGRAAKKVGLKVS